MLRTPPHSGDPADRIGQLLVVVRVGLVATLTARCVAGLASQVRWQRPGLATGPREVMS
jgi:hypothetical protein